MTEKAGIIERTVAMIAVFADGEGALGITQLSQRLSLPPATVHRLLDHLIALGIVERASQRRYRIGTELFRISNKVTRKLRTVELARPVMRELATDIGQSCLLSIFIPDKLQRITAAKVDPPAQMLRFRVRMYEHFSVAWGAAGRAILAQLQPELIARAIEEAPPSPLSNEALPDSDIIERNLEVIRRDGYALAYGELNSKEAVAISAPFFGAGQVAGSLTVVIPTFRFQEDMLATVVPRLQFAVKQISQRLGASDIGAGNRETEPYGKPA